MAEATSLSKYWVSTEIRGTSDSCHVEASSPASAVVDMSRDSRTKYALQGGGRVLVKDLEVDQLWLVTTFGPLEDGMYAVQLTPCVRAST